MRSVVGVIALAAVAVGSYLALRFVVLPVVRRIIRRSRYQWDDVLVDRSVLRRLSLFGPALIFRIGIEYVDVSDVKDTLVDIANIILIVGAVWALGAVLRAFTDLYRRLDVARSRPIKAYLQLLLIVAWVLAGVLVLSIVTEVAVVRLLAGAGAAMAILLLVFRDTILSMVAGIQLINNNLLAIGDEIDVPDLGLNGVVQDIALHTVTIRGSDKKTTTIPTHYLTTHVFKNWDGIDEAGGRHLRRAVYIDASTVRFLTVEELERYKRFEPLATYMGDKLDEIEKWNGDREPPSGMQGDPRRLTNLGTFRAYVLEYLKRHRATATEHLKVMVRQRQPTPHGIPIEIYAYSLPTDLVSYEGVAADLMDHILAMGPEFGLRVHQEPGSEDVRSSQAAL